MPEGELVGVFVGPQRGLMHEAAYGEMGHQQSVELLANQDEASLVNAPQKGLP